MAKELTEKQKKAVQLLAFKAENGMTNKEIAKEVGVTERTLYLWKNDKDFQVELAYTAEIIMNTYVMECYQGLRSIINSVTSRDSDKLRAIRLTLQTQGRLTYKKELNMQDNWLDVVTVLEELRTSGTENN